MLPQDVCVNMLRINAEMPAQERAKARRVQRRTDPMTRELETPASAARRAVT
jgi:hypothetical protein